MDVVKCKYTKLSSSETELTTKTEKQSDLIRNLGQIGKVNVLMKE